MTTLTEGKHAGGFLVWEVLRDYTRETVTIASGAGQLEPGTVLGKVTASGKFLPHAPAAADGTQTAVAICYARVDATAADADGVAVFQGEAPEVAGAARGQAAGLVGLVEAHEALHAEVAQRDLGTAGDGKTGAFAVADVAR